MADAITITGLKEIQKSLYSYSQRLGDRVVLGALRQGANLIKREAQANAPVSKNGNPKLGTTPGNLKRGIVVRKSKIHRGKLSSDMIGLYLTIKSTKKTDPFYGRFQESGWKAGNRLIPGKKFIDRAFHDKKEEAVALIVKSATSAADLLAAKLGL
jgi:HK97 gp10 family phage protein